MMKKDRIAKIKKWQLLRFRSRDSVADLSALSALTVGRRAFARKKRLQAVILPAELSAVKTEAFMKCRELTQVTFSKQNAVGISEKAFWGCSALRRIENSEMIFSVGAHAFYGCTALEEITFGRELRRIGEQAFARCHALRALTLPSGIDRIGKKAFSDCINLKKTDVQEGITALAPSIFYNCRSLTDVTLPESLSAIPTSAFRGCTALQRIFLPHGVRRVEKKAFLGCSALSQVELSLGCERIGAHAFARCQSLSSVAIPRTVRRLGFAAFGLGKKQEKTLLYVENEYMLRRMRRLLFFCGSLGRAEAVLVGKTVEQRKRERRRTTLEKEPAHLIDHTTAFEQKPNVYLVDPDKSRTTDRIGNRSDEMQSTVPDSTAAESKLPESDALKTPDTDAP